MKRITTLMMLASLAGCASAPFTFEGENANKGFIVLSTGIADACIDEFDHTTLLIRDAKTDESVGGPIIKNLFSEPEFEENHVQVNGIPLAAGDYVIRDFLSPTPFFALIPQFHAIKPIKFTVKPGQVQYQGYIFFDAVKGACSKDSAVVTLKNMKKRDMEKVAESNPQLFAAQ